MQLLVIDNDLRAYPAPEIANIAEFKALIRRDKGSPGDSGGKLKQRASRELAYIFHMVDHGSPYRIYIDDLREIEVKKDLFRDYPAWEEDQVVRDAMAKYRQLRDTEMILLLKAATSAVNRLKDYFDNVSFTTIDDEGRPLHSAKDVVSNLANLGKVVEGLQKLREQVEKDELGTNANRRGVETNPYNE
jgi:hypothetical protein